MGTRKRNWVMLFALPLLIGLAMWPVAVRHRERARAQEAAQATRALRIRIEEADGVGSFLNLDLVEKLIAQGADVNIHLDDHTTMLHYVMVAILPSESDRVPLVRLLLRHGAHVNAQTRDGTTPLMAAAYGVAGSKVVQVLLDYGAQVNLQRHNGSRTETALTIAEEKHNDAHIIHMLKAAGARE